MEPTAAGSRRVKNLGLYLFGLQILIFAAGVYSISVTVGRSPGEPGFLIPLLLFFITPPILFGSGYRLSRTDVNKSGLVAKYLNGAGLAVYFVWLGYGVLQFLSQPL